MRCESMSWKDLQKPTEEVLKKLYQSGKIRARVARKVAKWIVSKNLHVEEIKLQRVCWYPPIIRLSSFVIITGTAEVEIEDGEGRIRLYKDTAIYDKESKTIYVL